MHWVLNRIQKSGLKLNKDKCIFGVTKISETGISPDHEKVKEIKYMLFSKSKQDLQRFFGIISNPSVKITS